MPATDPFTVGLMSNENMPRGVNWGPLSDPLYAEIAAIAPTRRIAPPAFSLSAISDYVRAIREVFGVRTLFAMHASARNETPLMALSALRVGARRAAFFVDPWPYSLDRIHQVCTYAGIRLAFIPYKEAFDRLKAKKSGRVKYVYLPFAADTVMFANTGQERDIDILSMGRRCEPLHQAILAYATAKGLNYQYRETTGFLKEPADLGRLVARSRYFVTTPPDLFSLQRTGGFSPLVMRYLEGLSAGCRLVGALPSSGEFEALLPRRSLLEVSPDGSDFAQRFEADADDAEGWAASAQASRIVRAEHSWANRAHEIVERLREL